MKIITNIRSMTALIAVALFSTVGCGDGGPGSPRDMKTETCTPKKGGPDAPEVYVTYNLPDDDPETIASLVIIVDVTCGNGKREEFEDSPNVVDGVEIVDCQLGGESICGAIAETVTFILE